MICHNRNHLLKENVNNKPLVLHLYDSLKIHLFKTMLDIKKIIIRLYQGEYSINKLF